MIQHNIAFDLGVILKEKQEKRTGTFSTGNAFEPLII